MSNRYPNPNERRSIRTLDYDRMNVPLEFRNVSLDAVSDEKLGGADTTVRAAIKGYVENIDTMYDKGAGLQLMGAEGVGKSAIAVLILRAIRERGYWGYFIPVADLREAVRSRLEFEDDSSVFDRCRSVDVLVLDNLTEMDGGDRFFGAAHITDLVAHRGQRGLLTIVTTRLDLDGIDRHLATFAKTTSGYVVPFTVKGKNLRATKAKELRSVIFAAAAKKDS